MAKNIYSKSYSSLSTTWDSVAGLALQQRAQIMTNRRTRWQVLQHSAGIVTDP
jgi:hypothetical protein